jgi:hypothetical protein
MSPRAARGIVFGKGLVLLLLAAVHVVAIPFEHARIRTRIPPDLVTEYAFWFGAIAAYFAPLGVVDMLASKHLEGRGSLGWRLALSSSIFSTVSCLIGLAVLGLSPGILLLVSGLLGFFVLLTPRRCARVAAELSV